MPVNSDISRYKTAGCCLVRNAVDPVLLGGIREDILAGIAARRAAVPGAVRYREFAAELHLGSARIAGLLQGEPFRSLVAAVIGPDADLRFTSSITKTSELGAHVDWHQDSGYDRDPEHDKFSFWIAVTASRREDGCLRIIQGSQNRGLLPHIQSRTLPRDKEVENVDESHAEDVEMEAGDILMLHRYVLHASWPNRSGRLRMALLAGFMPPKREYLDFEKLGAYRYFRRGLPMWRRVTDPDQFP